MDRNGCAVAALEEFCAWHGSDFGSSPSYLVDLDSAACAELLEVLLELKTRCAGLAQIRRADVPLQGLTRRLADWRDQVVYGRGFVLLRRLPIERMAEADIALAFAALSAHLGRTAPKPERLWGRDCAIPLGTGAGDLTALLCLNEPEPGIALKIASTVAVHNAMAAETPELLAKLYLGATPAFSLRGKKLYARLSPEAKSHAAALAHAEANALVVDFEPGDVLLLNNHHAVFGLEERHGPTGRGGALMRLSLESGLVAARPVPESAEALQPQGRAAERPAESQAAA